MSLQPAQTRPLERAASRRTVIRTAAWTAPAVSIAVAAPAFAAASTDNKRGTLVGTGTPPATPIKYNDSANASVKHVKWNLTFRNTGTVSLSALNIVCAFTEQSPVEITAFTVTPGAWTTGKKNSTFTATYTGTVGVGGTLSFTPDFTGANNSKGTLTVMIYDGTTLLATASGNWKP